MAGVDKSLILDGLTRLGIRPGDTIFAHSSLSCFGHVEGGAATVVDALVEAVDQNGNVAVPTFTWSFVGQNRPYDRLRTPGRVGRIPEELRLRRGTLRSSHPTHSVAAWGPQAEHITSGHRPTDSPCGRTSAFGPLVELNAKVLFLGCGLTPNTTLHAVEDWADLPYIADKTAKAEMIDEEGNTIAVSFEKEPRGHRGFYLRRSKIERAFDQAGVVTDAQIGAAAAQMIRIRDMMRVTMERLIYQPDILLCDNGLCEFCSAEKTRSLERGEQVVGKVRNVKAELGL